MPFPSQGGKIYITLICRKHTSLQHETAGEEQEHSRQAIQHRPHRTSSTGGQSRQQCVQQRLDKMVEKREEESKYLGRE